MEEENTNLNMTELSEEKIHSHKKKRETDEIESSGDRSCHETNSNLESRMEMEEEYGKERGYSSKGNEEMEEEIFNKIKNMDERQIKGLMKAVGDRKKQFLFMEKMRNKIRKILDRVRGRIKKYGSGRELEIGEEEEILEKWINMRKKKEKSKMDENEKLEKKGKNKEIEKREKNKELDKNEKYEEIKKKKKKIENTTEEDDRRNVTVREELELWEIVKEYEIERIRKYCDNEIRNNTKKSENKLKRKETMKKDILEKKFQSEKKELMERIEKGEDKEKGNIENKKKLLLEEKERTGKKMDEKEKGEKEENWEKNKKLDKNEKLDEKEKDKNFGKNREIENIGKNQNDKQKEMSDKKEKDEKIDASEEIKMKRRASRSLIKGKKDEMEKEKKNEENLKEKLKKKEEEMLKGKEKEIVNEEDEDEIRRRRRQTEEYKEERRRVLRKRYGMTDLERREIEEKEENIGKEYVKLMIRKFNKKTLEAWEEEIRTAGRVESMRRKINGECVKIGNRWTLEITEEEKEMMIPKLEEAERKLEEMRRAREERKKYEKREWDLIVENNIIRNNRNDSVIGIKRKRDEKEKELIKINEKEMEEENQNMERNEDDREIKNRKVKKELWRIAKWEEIDEIIGDNRSSLIEFISMKIMKRRREEEEELTIEKMKNIKEEEGKRYVLEREIEKENKRELEIEVKVLISENVEEMTDLRKKNNDYYDLEGNDNDRDEDDLDEKIKMDKKKGKLGINEKVNCKEDRIVRWKKYMVEQNIWEMIRKIVLSKERLKKQDVMNSYYLINAMEEIMIEKRKIRLKRRIDELSEIKEKARVDEEKIKKEFGNRNKVRLKEMVIMMKEELEDRKIDEKIKVLEDEKYKLREDEIEASREKIIELDRIINRKRKKKERRILERDEKRKKRKEIWESIKEDEEEDEWNFEEVLERKKERSNEIKEIKEDEENKLIRELNDKTKKVNKKVEMIAIAIELLRDNYRIITFRTNKIIRMIKNYKSYMTRSEMDLCDNMMMDILEINNYNKGIKSKKKEENKGEMRIERIGADLEWMVKSDGFRKIKIEILGEIREVIGKEVMRWMILKIIKLSMNKEVKDKIEMIIPRNEVIELMKERKIKLMINEEEKKEERGEDVRRIIYEINLENEINMNNWKLGRWKYEEIRLKKNRMIDRSRVEEGYYEELKDYEKKENENIREVNGKKRRNISTSILDLKKKDEKKKMIRETRINIMEIVKSKEKKEGEGERKKNMKEPWVNEIVIFGIQKWDIGKKEGINGKKLNDRKNPMVDTKGEEHLEWVEDVKKKDCQNRYDEYINLGGGQEECPGEDSMNKSLEDDDEMRDVGIGVKGGLRKDDEIFVEETE